MRYIYMRFIYPVKLDQISEISSYNASLYFYIFIYIHSCVCVCIYLYIVCVCVYIPIETVNEIYSCIS